MLLLPCAIANFGNDDYLLKVVWWQFDESFQTTFQWDMNSTVDVNCIVLYSKLDYCINASPRRRLWRLSCCLDGVIKKLAKTVHKFFEFGNFWCLLGIFWKKNTISRQRIWKYFWSLSLHAHFRANAGRRQNKHGRRPHDQNTTTLVIANSDLKHRDFWRWIHN